MENQPCMYSRSFSERFSWVFPDLCCGKPWVPDPMPGHAWSLLQDSEVPEKPPGSQTIVNFTIL